MSDFYGWFAGLATIGGFAYFLFGFATAYIYRWVKCRLTKTHMRVSWQVAGIVIGTAAIIITTMQSSVAYNQARDTAESVKDCTKEFHATLIARSKISEDNDRWSMVQRKALGDWLRQLLVPPPPYNEMDVSDPRRQQWGLELTRKYSAVIQQAQREQDENAQERAAHPLPELTCGR